MRRPELSVGVSFQAGPDGSYVVSGVSPSGPAAGKVKPGDRLLEISKERLENGRCRQDCLRFLA